MTTKRENALSNVAALNFELSPEDMAAISALAHAMAERSIRVSMAGRWD